MNLSQNLEVCRTVQERPLGRRRLGGFVYPSVFIFTRVYPRRRTCNLMSSWDPTDRRATGYANEMCGQKGGQVKQDGLLAWSKHK